MINYNRYAGRGGFTSRCRFSRIISSEGKDRCAQSSSSSGRFLLGGEINVFVNFQDDSKEPEAQEDDPWAGLPYTVDLETGECERLQLLSLISIRCLSRGRRRRARESDRKRIYTIDIFSRSFARPFHKRFFTFRQRVDRNGFFFYLVCASIISDDREIPTVCRRQLKSQSACVTRVSRAVRQEHGPKVRPGARSRALFTPGAYRINAAICESRSERSL